ncbi:MAG: RNA-binding transcriptional accessory protein [Spartobacteria bacterium]|nr:RNA-binding transcriptional accessory protein [Spartobacteria bacterium]
MTTKTVFDPVPSVVEALALPARQVAAVVGLFDEGNTVPFIARYRKEAHGNLDEVQIGQIQEKTAYFRTLQERRETILESIRAQEKLTPELEQKILACTSKTALEDLYLPYKPKRRTRATIAREKGLAPLADFILAQDAPEAPEVAAAAYIDPEKGVATIEEALAGARDIVAEQVAENAEVRSLVRQVFAEKGLIHAEKANPDDPAPTKFEQYYDFSEKLSDMPSHRFLAIRRGETEGVLRKNLDVDPRPIIDRIRALVGLRDRGAWGKEYGLAVEDAFKRMLKISMELDVFVEAKVKADRAAVDVFAKNLRNLLLAAPFGGKPVIGIDPGLRTGCKCVAIDATGKYLDTVTIYPSQGPGARKESAMKLGAFINTYKPDAVAVGNGTAGRETEAFVKEVLTLMKRQTPVVSVSEAGASVYSASEVAREEFPDLDLTIRGAISIARRLQDPLSELVKVDPKSIGVGQYQHDVYPALLQDKLEEVVVSCVNHVGVELNTASAFLLARVAGIGKDLGRRIIEHRNGQGSFKSRKDLLKVSGLGPKTFEQAAGFLRIREGAHPLDASAVHPERYALVQRMADDLGVDLATLVGNPALVKRLDMQRYVSDDVGLPTLQDIVAELQKPGRDPREQFEQVGFRDDVREISDLKPGMELNGIVTNVTAFGAFVDVGVHQDGLAHISQLSNTFIRDPSEVVQAGDRLKVWVVEVDAPRKRISLTAVKEKLEEAMAQAAQGPGAKRPQGARPPKQKPSGPPKGRSGFQNNAFANL